MYVFKFHLIDPSLFFSHTTLRFKCCGLTKNKVNTVYIYTEFSSISVFLTGSYPMLLICIPLSCSNVVSSIFVLELLVKC